MLKNTDKGAKVQPVGLSKAQVKQAVAEGWSPDVQAAVASASNSKASAAPVLLAQAQSNGGVAQPSPLTALRKRFPQYDNIGDQDLADALYQRFYSEMPRAEYDQRLGLASSNDAPVIVEGTDGQTFEFPAGTDRATMQEALQRHYARQDLQSGSEASSTEPPMRQPMDEIEALALATAARKRQQASQQPEAPKRGLRQIIYDNVIGDPNDGVTSLGEKLGTLLNMGGESMTLGIVGDEAAAGADALIGRGGSYDENLARYRGNEAAMRESNPIVSFGADVLPAFIPGTALARGVGAAKSTFGRALTGLLGGGLAGGTYGFMEGEGENDRLEGAFVGGILGGGLGLAAEPLARGAGAVYRAVGPGAAATARRATSALGLDDAGARMVAQAVERDFPYAADNLRRAGPNATNAQIGNNTKGLLDAVINRPGAAGAASLARVESMAANAGQYFTRTLDEALGAPVGVARQQRQIMRDSAGGRLEAYSAAYARPIDYSAPTARTLEGLLDRVPEEAIRKAEKLMRTEGAASRQIRATIGEDGRVVYDTLPDVQQIDYITRALRDMGGFGVGEGATQGRAYSTLARDLRRQLDQLVPEYRGARAAGQDAIANREAAEFGESLLSPSMKMDVAEDALADMTEGEKGFVRQGMRDYIEEVMANTKAALTDQNMDAREALRPLKDMLSRAGQRKLRALLGDDEAGRLIAAGEETFSALNLRASVATNSKTAPRLIAEGILDEAVPPTVGEALSEGRGILGAMSVIARPLLDDASVQRAARKDSVMERVGQALLSPVQRTAQGGLLAQQLAPALRAADATKEVTQRRVRGLLSTVGATQGANITR